MIKQSLIKELAKIIGHENVLFSTRDLLAYSYDATQKCCVPEAIVFPRNTAEISMVMRAAKREGIPIIPRGAGTGISGGTVPVNGGIVLELSRMNRILTVDKADWRTVVEPGVVNLDLQNVLAPLGFIYPPDPASQKVCTIGGNIGENAGGPLCLKYGVTSKYVCGIEVVLSNGEIVNLGGSVEDVPGYDLRGLLIGSEGTLGIATKITLHIIPKPEATRTMLAIFDNLDDASQTVSDIIGVGIIPAALELMDKSMCWAIEQSVHAGYPVDAEGVLLIEVTGLKDSLEVKAEEISAICRRNKVRELRLAATAAEYEAIWKGRKGAFGSVARICPPYLVNDGTVPRNQLVPALRRVNEIAEKYHLTIANVAHAGDGNLHPLIMFDRNNPEETAAARRAGEEVLDVCIDLGGTISGEHGIGCEKLGAMNRLFSPADIAIMHKVKQIFDPDGILNPGKLFPQTESTPIKQPIRAASRAALKEGKEFNQMLAEIVSSENVTDEEVRASFKIDGIMPGAIVFPSATEQISQIVELANQSGKTIVPWGSGSSQIGSCVSSADVVLCLRNMDKILDLDPSNSTVKVEAGTVNSELQRKLTEHKLFFPSEPPYADVSTIGGELATGASGPRRFSYGMTRDLVLGITVVIPTGEIVHAGGKTMKNVAGLDLTRMFFGSWGTLGIITEAVLRLFPIPEVSNSIWATFLNLEDALRAIDCLLNSVLIPSSIDLVDDVAGYHLGYGSRPKEDETLLIVSTEGDNETVSRHLKEINGITKTNKASNVATFSGEEAVRALSGVHKSILSADPLNVQGKISVPISKTGDMFKAVKAIASRYNMQTGIVAHCGNGILYPYFTAGDTDIARIISDMKQAAEGLGGFFIVEAAPLRVRKDISVLSHRSDYPLMKRLKKAFDPNNILNPGKLIDGLD